MDRDWELLIECYRKAKINEINYQKNIYSRSTYYRRKTDLDATIKFLLSVIKDNA